MRGETGRSAAPAPPRARTCTPTGGKTGRAGRLATALGAALAIAASPLPAVAAAVFEVSAEVVARRPRLEVRVTVTNRGDRAVAPLHIAAEIAGGRREAQLAAGIAAGAGASAVLEFEATDVRSGLHALTLRLEHPVDGAKDAAGNPPLVSQMAWVLLALDASPPPAVRLTPEPLQLELRGALAVEVASEDGAPHRVRLRAHTSRGLYADPPFVDLNVPGRGPARTTLTLMRSGAPRGTTHAVLLVAETRNEPVLRTSIATTTVLVAPDPSLLPRLRPVLLGVAIALLLFAAWAEASGRHPKS